MTETETLTEHTYGTPVMAAPIGVVCRNGRWQRETVATVGYLSDTADHGMVSVQFAVGGSHHRLPVAEVAVIVGPTAEQVAMAEQVARAAAVDAAKRATWPSVPDVIRARLRREADEAGAAVIYWANR